MLCLHRPRPRELGSIIMGGNVFTTPTPETDVNFHWVLYTFYRSRCRTV